MWNNLTCNYEHTGNEWERVSGKIEDVKKNHLKILGMKNSFTDVPTGKDRKEDKTEKN